jgi:hypothetical protein
MASFSSSSLNEVSGRSPKHAVQNLLAGLATCGVCGGGLVVEQSNNRKGRYSYYICHRRRHHGSACTNTLRIAVPEMNEAVLQAVEAHVFTPDAIEQVVALTERDDVRERQIALQREAKELEKRIARLVAAVETAGDITALTVKLRERRHVGRVSTKSYADSGHCRDWRPEYWKTDSPSGVGCCARAPRKGVPCCNGCCVGASPSLRVVPRATRSRHPLDSTSYSVASSSSAHLSLSMWRPALRTSVRKTHSMATTGGYWSRQLR